MEYAVSSKVDFDIISKSDVMNIVAHTNKIVRMSRWAPDVYITKLDDSGSCGIKLHNSKTADPRNHDECQREFESSTGLSVYEIWESEEAYTYAHMTPHLLERRENLINTLCVLIAAGKSYSKWKDLSLCCAKFIRACDIVGEYPTAVRETITSNGDIVLVGSVDALGGIGVSASDNLQFTTHVIRPDDVDRSVRFDTNARLFDRKAPSQTVNSLAEDVSSRENTPVEECILRIEKALEKIKGKTFGKHSSEAAVVFLNSVEIVLDRICEIDGD